MRKPEKVLERAAAVIRNGTVPQPRLTVVHPDDPPPWAGPPVPFGASAAPPRFPTAVFPPAVGRFVEAVTESTQTPADMAAMLAVATVAAGAARKYEFEVRPGWVQPANVYVVVSLNPSERKSAVFKLMTAAVYDFEAAENERLRPEIAQAASVLAALTARHKYLLQQTAKARGEFDRGELEREIQDVATEIDARVVPAVPKFVTDEATVEAVADGIVRQNGRLFQAAAEGTLFEIAAGRYADGENFDVYLKGYEGDALRIDRIGRGRSHHDAPALTCAVTVQPSVLADHGRSAKARGKGFVARWMFAVPEQRAGLRRVRTEPVPAAVQAAYRDIVLAAAVRLANEYLIPHAKRAFAVCVRLGHANPAITLRVYAHVMPSDDDKLADGLGRMVG